MNTQERIKAYIDSQDEPKRADILTLHQHLLQQLPNGRLWYLDGKDDTGKVVTNPSIGHGQYTIHYKNGSTKEFYQIGISANTSGVSVYIMGLEDKKIPSPKFRGHYRKGKRDGLLYQIQNTFGHQLRHSG